MYQRILMATALVSMLVVGSASADHEDKGMKQHHQGMEQKTDSHSHEPMHKHFVRKVVAAVSKTGIDSAQAQQVTEAINRFKTTKMQFKMKPPLPLDAFKGEHFDKSRFTEILLSKPTAMATAKGELLERIYGILNEEQRKIFTREFTAPMVEMMIKKGMMKGKKSMEAGKSCAGHGGGKH
ncbi:MAG: hypothetical protein PVG22_19180 [Chromatiales bacterium]|jgi:hypothetical protein